MVNRAKRPKTLENLTNCPDSMKQNITKYIGAHVSGAGGLYKSFFNNHCIKGKAFALFLKNQRRWSSPPLSDSDIEKFKNATKKYGGDEILNMIVPHGSYLINLGNPDEEKRNRSFESFIDDLQRCFSLGITKYNIHPGSTVGNCSSSESIKFIADKINLAHLKVPNVCILLETMAGQGNVIGSKFEDVAAIIDLIDNKSRIGVCLDTCHIFAAGYDIRDKNSYEKTMELFDKVVGFKYLKAVHLNDSKTELGSGKDRHENIGVGKIGMKCFELIVNDCRFDHIPLILETPDIQSNQVSKKNIYEEEISLLYDLIKK